MYQNPLRHVAQSQILVHSWLHLNSGQVSFHVCQIWGAAPARPPLADKGIMDVFIWSIIILVHWILGICQRNVDSTCGQNHSHLVGYISGPGGQLNIKLSFLKGRFFFHQQGACENSPLPRREYNFKAKCKIYLNLLQSCPSANCGWNSLAPNFGRFTKSKSIIIISLTSENDSHYRIIAISFLCFLLQFWSQTSLAFCWKLSNFMQLCIIMRRLVPGIVKLS